MQQHSTNSPAGNGREPRTAADQRPPLPRSPRPLPPLKPTGGATLAGAGAPGPGVDMRDWLAGLAMQGMLAKGLEVQADRALSQQEKDELVAQRAYRLADAMLAVRKQNTHETMS